MSNITNVFLDRYRQLEEMANEKYRCESGISQMERDSEYGKYRSRITYCRNVRNILSHNPKVGDSFAVEVSEPMVRLLEELIEEISKTAESIMIKSKYVMSCNINDKVLPAMRIMNDNNYTHIPILDNGIVKGVVSENTLLSFIIDEEIVEINSETKFLDLEKYLPIDAHKGEIFKFVKDNTTVTELAEIFRKAMKRQERIGMIFVTKNGVITDKVKGIITAWDLSVI